MRRDGSIRGAGIIVLSSSRACIRPLGGGYHFWPLSGSLGKTQAGISEREAVVWRSVKNRSNGFITLLQGLSENLKPALPGVKSVLRGSTCILRSSNVLSIASWGSLDTSGDFGVHLIPTHFFTSTGLHGDFDNVSPPMSPSKHRFVDHRTSDAKSHISTLRNVAFPHPQMDQTEPRGISGLGTSGIDPLPLASLPTAIHVLWPARCMCIAKPRRPAPRVAKNLAVLKFFTIRAVGMSRSEDTAWKGVGLH
jgi:hypothetical protein